MGKRRGVYRDLVGKHEGKRPLGRPWRRWEDNITTNLEEVDGRGMLRVWGRREAYTGFWWGNMRERDRLGDPGVDGRII
jgi:hypothetical protein